MAAIEELIRSIADARLRDALTVEVAKLKANKKFGLVFEEHLPETVLLPGLAIKLGARVMLKASPEAGAFRVIEEVNGKKVKVIPDHVTKSGVIRGLPDSIVNAAVVMNRTDLVVAKAFGEPMYPALIPVDAVERAPGKPWHVLINADNYHALQLLQYGYTGKVDVIYIDPPYNTGARNWKYNNDYIDTNDGYRHSKWLSMMKKRLKLARGLLADDGVLIVTIDENEDAALSLLLREIFPEYSDTPVAIVHNPRGIQGDNFSYCHETAHFLIREGQKRLAHRRLPPEEQDPTHFRNWGGESTRDTAKTAFYPVYFKGGKFLRAGDVPAKTFHPGKAYKDLVNGYRPLKNGELEFWPIDGDGVERKWRYGNETIGEVADLLVVEERDGIPQVLLVKDTGQYKTVWKDARFDASSNGTALLSRMGVDFPYAKSLYAVLECLQATTMDRKNAVILDFFAGSGTTCHAAALLNSLDGGSRRAILVTNNEVEGDQAKALLAQGLEPGDAQWEKHGIADAVTWPRLQRAISGKMDSKTPLTGKYKTGQALSDGFKENAAYFKLDFLDPDEVSRGEQFEAVIPILWMLAGSVGACASSKGTGKWFVPSGNRFAVLLKEDCFGGFREELAKRDDITHVFLVTDSAEAFNDMVAALGSNYTCLQLYRSYIDTFRINLGEPGTRNASDFEPVPAFAEGGA